MTHPQGLIGGLPCNTTRTMAAKMGPIEASFRARAVEARRRLVGKAPVVRPLLIPPPATVSEPTVSLPPRFATTKARRVIVEVAQAHGLNWRELIGPSRERRVVVPRNEAAFRLVVELRLSYPKAGRVLGNKDHTTVLHSCRRHAQTSPEAAEIWRRHVECETDDRAHKKREALRLHFEEGLAVGTISAKVKVMPVTVAKWIAAASCQAPFSVSPAFNTTHK